MKKLPLPLLIIGGYLLAAVLFTWPLSSRLETHGFGVDEDSPYHIWHNWWFKFALLDLKQNPLQTDYIFHPQKISLLYDANAFVFSFLTLPFQLLSRNVVLSSNIVFLGSFALSGFFAFHLAQSFLKDKAAAFTAGLIFAFNPYTLAQAVDGHTNLTTTWIIPVYTLFLIRSLKNFRWLNVLAAGLAASLQFYNDFTYTSFLIIETFLITSFFLAQTLLRENRTKKIPAAATAVIAPNLIVLLTAAVLSFPIVVEIIKVSLTGFRAGSPLWVQNFWSADLLAFIRPNSQSSLLKNPWTPNIGTVEGTAFVGYTLVIILLIYFFMILRKKIRLDREKNLLLFLAFSFFTLMLGPSLHYKNSFQFGIFWGKLIFPMPFLLLHKIPLIGEIQESGRMFPFFILPLAVLVGFGIKSIRASLPGELVPRMFSALIPLMIILEYLPLPFPITDLSRSPVFEKIRLNPSNGSVLVLPLGFNSGNYSLGQSPIGSLQFYQAYFQKPSFRGTVARLPYSYFEYYQKLPVIPYLIDPDNPINLEAVNKEQTRKIFMEELHINYIVLFEKKYKKPLGKTVEVIEKLLEGKKFYDSENIKGYLLE